MKGWVITRYEDVKHVAVTHSDMSADRLSPFFAAAPADRQSSYVHLMTYLGKWMVFRDPPSTRVCADCSPKRSHRAR